MAYKYQSPHDWLLTKAESWNKEELFMALSDVAGRLDSDSIQDLFQVEMSKDGYFNKRESTS